MTVDLATLGLEVRSDGLVAATGHMDKMGQSSDKLEKKSKKNLVSMQAGFKKLGLSASRLKSKIFGIQGAMASLGMSIGFGMSLNAWSKLDEGLIGIKKTTGLAADEMTRMRSELSAMAREVPVSGGHLRGIAQVAGQLGVSGVDNISKFTETLAKMEIASDLVGEQGATQLARLVNVTGGAISEIATLGSVIVSLGNNMAVTEAEIAEMAIGIGQATSVFAVTAEDASALGAAMGALGVASQIGGTAVGKSMRMIEKTINEGGRAFEYLQKMTEMTGEQLKQTFEKDSTTVFTAFIKGIGKMTEAGETTSQVLERFGITEERMLRVLPALSENYEQLSFAIKLKNKEQIHATALDNEAAEATKGYGAQLTLTKNYVNQILSTFGEAFAPTVMKLTNEFRKWTDANRELIKTKVPEYVDKIKNIIKTLYGLYSALPSELTNAAGIGLVGAYLFGPTGGAIGSLLSITGLLPKLVNTIAGFAAASAGELAWGDFATANAEELVVLLDEIAAKKIKDPFENMGTEARLAYLKDQEMILAFEVSFSQQAELNVALIKEEADSLKEKAEAQKIVTEEKEKEIALSQGVEKVVDRLKIQIEMLSMSAKEQAIYTAQLEAGVKAGTAMGDVVAGLASSFFSLKDAQTKANAATEESKKLVIEMQTPYEKFLHTMKDLNEKLVSGNLDATTFLRAYKEALSGMSTPTEDAPKKVATAWEEAAKNVHNVWTDMLTDLFSFQDINLSELTSSLGDALISTVTNSMTKAFTDSMDADSGFFDSMGAGLGAINPAMLGAGVAMSGLSAFMAKKDEPSFGEGMSKSIDDLIEALKENTRSLNQQLEGLSDFAISVENMANDIINKEIFKDRTLGGNFLFPDIADAQTMVTNDKNVNKLKEEYWSLAPGEDSADIISQLYKKLTTDEEGGFDAAGMTEFYNIMKTTAVDSGAVLMESVKGILGFSENASEDMTEMWERMVKNLVKGSTGEQAENTAVGIIAVMEGAFAQIALYGKDTAKDISSYMDTYDSSKLTAHEQALKAVNDSLGEYNATATDQISILQGIVDIGPSLISSGALTEAALQETAETLSILIQSTEDYNRVLEETNEYYVGLQRDTIKAMNREMGVGTDGTELTPLQLAMLDIDTAAKAYNDTLRDQGMSYIEAAMYSKNYSHIMKEQAKEAIVSGMLDPAEYLVATHGMSDLEKTIYGVNKAYEENYEILKEIDPELVSEGSAFMKAWAIELSNVQADSMKSMVDFYKNLQVEIEDLIWDLQGGGLAAVQSEEGMMNRYNELLQEAAETGDISRFQSFITGEFAEFMKGYGNWGEVSAMIIEDLRMLSDVAVEKANLGDVTDQLADSNISLAEIVKQTTEMVKVMESIRGTSGFAAGGYHSGGLRLVGERGPELEMTGPSHIMNNADLRSMVASSQPVNVQVVVKMGTKEFEDFTTDVLQTNPDAQDQVRRIAKAG